MTRVLVVGYDPNSADFTGPALPRGIDAEKIRGRGGRAQISLQITLLYPHSAKPEARAVSRGTKRLRWLKNS